MKFQAEAEFCAPNVKDFDQAAGWVSGFRMAAYGGVTCQAVGLDLDRMQSEVGRVFDAGESTAVEQGLIRVRMADDPDGDWEAAPDLTPTGGAVSPTVGMALLEGEAAQNYIGMPVLHMPVTIASLLSHNNSIEFSGDTLVTKLGSKVVAGAGYEDAAGPAGTAPAAGEKWMFATGGVLVRRGPVEVRQAIAHESNEVFVLGERGYVVAVDCFTAAVRVKVE